MASKQNLVAHDRLWVDTVLPSMPAQARTIDALRLDAFKLEENRKGQAKRPPNPYTFLSGNATFILSQAQRTARTQVFIDQALLVTGLERYRLTRGQYPESLQELLPAYAPWLPNDPVGNGPYHYRRLPSGDYQLWSVGWDGKDDGGETVQEVDLVVMSTEGDETQGGSRFDQNRKVTPRESPDRGDWAWATLKK
jgi:hypothetical protein